MRLLSDRELEAIKERKFKELQKRASSIEQKKEQVNWYQILKKVFKGRAWEVLNAALSQFPDQMAEIEASL